MRVFFCACCDAAPPQHTIAIDGPAASGKSSAASAAAERLGFCRLDSGLFYRAITLALVRAGLADPAAAAAQAVVANIDIAVRDGRILMDGSDVTDELHTPAIDSRVGGVAKHLYIRNRVHALQHKIIESATTGIVVDGRDIGTVVLPNAFLKVFITARDTTRAQRRVDQSGGDYSAVLADIQRRDHQDISREHGPLKVADDAVVIENDSITLAETVDRIVELYRERVRETQDK